MTNPMIADGRVIKSIVAAECVIPLARPVKFKGRKITARSVVMLKIETFDGLIGEAFSSPRGTPLLETIKFLGRDYVGGDTRMIAALGTAAGQKRVNGRPVLTLAISLFDIALWGIAAKAAQLPLFQLLGGLRDKVPMMAVAGYFLNERTIDDVRDEVARYIDQGYSQVKINLSGEDPLFDRRYVHACMKVAEGRLSADAHWSWASMGEALATCDLIDDAGLRFIEDPFGVHDVDLTCHLQSRLRTSIAYGEDLSSVPVMGMILDKIRVLRLDPTACGGVTGAMQALALARASGTVVMPHVRTALNGQIAGTSAVMEAVETIPDMAASWEHRLMKRQPNIVNGELVLDQEPGNGIEIDWGEVESRSSNFIRIDFE